MIDPINIYKHLKTVNTHRRLVRQNCFRAGLYWQDSPTTFPNTAPLNSG